MTLASVVLQTTHHKVFDFQAIGDSIFPARKIACAPVLLLDGKFARDVPV